LKRGEPVSIDQLKKFRGYFVVVAFIVAGFVARRQRGAFAVHGIPSSPPIPR